MAKNFITTLVFVFISNNFAFGCDLCGCGNGSTFFGIMPTSHRGIAGIRQRYSSYDSHIGIANLQSHELFKTTEVYGRFFPIKNVQLLTFLPYNVNKQSLKNSSKSYSLQGLGDLSLLVHYNVFNSFWDSTTHTVDQNLLIGVGTKIPSGKYKFDILQTDQVANPNFQLGTGSVDLIVNTIYTIRHKNFGVNADFTYKINGSNSNSYKYGNKISSTMLLFWQKQINKLVIMPNTGLYVEHSKKDRTNNIVNKQSGGWVIMGTIGAEVSFSKISIGLNAQIPLLQRLAGAELHANTRGLMHITYLF